MIKKKQFLNFKDKFEKYQISHKGETMQSKKIALSSILCSSLLASFALGDVNATNHNAQNSGLNSADGGGAFNQLAFKLY